VINKILEYCKLSRWLFYGNKHVLPSNLWLAYLSFSDLHWNETAGGIEGVLADEENTFQQNKSSNGKNNSYSNAVQKEITLPSRLIYYINRDSETPYHILDTRARHQQKHDKVG